MSFDFNFEDLEVGSESGRSLGRIFSFLGWLLLGGLMLVTAVHAVNIVTAMSVDVGSDSFYWVRVGAVALAELFAIVTAVLLATHRVRAAQRPAALTVEAFWFVFACMNLVASFALESGREWPGLIQLWVAYGLPVAALMIGVAFYVMYRLDPSAVRAEEMAEFRENVRQQYHKSAVEVLTSAQMRSALRQMQWLELPERFGRDLGLSDDQIAAVTGDAPELYRRNGDAAPELFQLAESEASSNGRTGG